MPERTAPEHAVRELAAPEHADPNAIWQVIVGLVIDTRDQWRRDVVAVADMPFSRTRVLRRVARAPMTITQLAETALMDAPAASVAVSDLEDAGYVVREPSPQDRRRKLVHITAAGRELLDRIAAVDDPPPATLAAATPAQLAALQEVFAPHLG